MENIAWTKETFILNGKPLIILGGEVNYFRIAREDWLDRLMKLRQAGLNTVAFYIPWEWHEHEEGKYDFTGKTHPRKDLAGWLQLCRDTGLYAIPRIGPYIYSEWVGSGIPGWLLKNHPEVKSENIVVNMDGALAAQETGGVSYLNEVYLKHVDRWYTKLANLFKQHLLSKGGNIIFIQPDNEIGGVVPYDYKEHVIIRYRNWLKKKYGKIEKLNRAHRSNYRDFDSIEPPKDNPKDYTVLKRWFDWDRFRYYYFTLYAERLTAMLRQKGIDTPMLYNCPMEPTYHYEYPHRLGKEGVVGLDHYPVGSPNQPVFNYEVLPKLIFNLELMREINNKSPLIIPECQIGLWNDLPRLYPADLELYYYTSLAHGAKSYSFYQFAGGENPLNFGRITKSYDYQAPVAGDGSLRPSYYMVKGFSEWLKANTDLLYTAKDYDVGYGFYFPYHTFYPAYPEAFDFGDTSKVGLKADIKSSINNLLYEGLLKSIIIAGVNMEFADLEKATLSRLKKYPQLWVFSLDFMSARVQQKLVAYAEGGGKLVLNPMVPWLDENMNECRIIERTLSIKERRLSESGHADILGVQQVPLEKPLEEYKVNKEAKVIARISGGKVSGFEVTVGKGRITLLSGGLRNYMREHEEVVRRIVAKDGISLCVTSSNPEILAYRRSGRGKTYLFVFNYHGMDIDTVIKTRVNNKEICLNLHLPQRTSQIFKLCH